MKIKTFLLAGALMFAVATASIQAEAGTTGCLLGGAGGGFGGSKIGKGSGQLAATALGALLGCAVGSKIQDVNQQPQPQYNRSQPQYNRYPPRQPQPPFQSRYDDFNARYGPPSVQPVRPACPYSREYQSTVTIGGKQVPAYGQACSYDGGVTWQLGSLTPVPQ